MMHDVIDNSNCEFGISPKVYPVIVVGADGQREGALFTQREMQRAIKRMNRYPHLKETVFQKVDAIRSDKSFDWDLFDWKQAK